MNFLIFPMSEVLSASVESSELLETVCREVQKLYPQIGEIQSFCSANKHVSFWVVSKDAPFEEKDFLKVQQAIITKFAKALPVYKCSLPCILQVRTSDILAQNRAGTTYMDEVFRAVEAEFTRDEIHVAYENGTFIVYGAAPRDQSILRGSIMSKIPHTLPCRLEFKSGAEWEDNQEVANAVQRANASFIGIDIPSSTGVFSGIMLSASQLYEAAMRRISPPQ